MTPGRVLIVILALILAASLALGTLGAPPSPPGRSDEVYIAIARSQPEVFRAGTPRQVTVQRGDPVIVEFVFDRERYRVHIDSRTDAVTRVERVSN
jgi:hypothetical protein